MDYPYPVHKHLKIDVLALINSKLVDCNNGNWVCVAKLVVLPCLANYSIEKYAFQNHNKEGNQQDPGIYSFVIGKFRKPVHMEKLRTNSYHIPTLQACINFGW